MTEIVYPVWRQRLARSLHVNRSQVPAKHYQVASVSSSGRPKNRTMVFRGFLSNTQSLLSVTDLRSDKIEEWQGGGKSHFEICWYFSGSREQFRLAGEVVLISNCLDTHYKDPVLGKQTKESLLKQQWSNLSTNAQQPFYSSSPKAPFDENPVSPNLLAGLGSQANVSNNELDSIKSAQNNNVQSQFEMSDNFCVIIFIPYNVDYLDLKSKPQQRCLYDIQDDWKEIFVNP
jgi:pyridoxamine 5'-phosphate oxidase